MFIMVLIKYIVLKCTVGYQVFKSKATIKHLMYLDIKIFSKNEKKKKKQETLIQTFWIYCQDLGMEFWIENVYYFIIKLIMKKGKRETIPEIEMPITKSLNKMKITNTWESKRTSSK